jgi:lipooligosaccharide transport system permease protein
VVSIVLPRLVSFEGTLRRSASVAERNLGALKMAYWVVLISGFLEALLYLLSIGDLTLAGGQVVSYAGFVAPAMLAASAMSGALAETTFNFFGKMKYMRLYDSVLATPVRPFEIALGELGWAMARGALYSAAFLIVMVAMDLTTPGWALLAFPASVLVGFAFGALGMMLSTFMRSWQDFDLMATIQFTIFLFSGTFVPVEGYPVAVRWLVELSPLYHAVGLLRGITTGVLGWAQVGHVAYLLGLTALGLVVAGRRMGRLLLK